MRKIIAIGFILGFIGTAHANLVGWTDLNGNHFVYDSDQNITWYDFPKELPFSAAQTWVSSLNLNGVTGWRLPNAPNLPIDQSGQRLNVGELGYLWYNELGNTIAHAHSPYTYAQDDGFNVGPFMFFGLYGHWTGVVIDAVHAWDFIPAYGTVGADHTFPGYYNWTNAVHDGNPFNIPTVPEPTVLISFGLGLVGLAGVRNKFKS